MADPWLLPSNIFFLCLELETSEGSELIDYKALVVVMIEKTDFIFLG